MCSNKENMNSVESITVLHSVYLSIKFKIRLLKLIVTVSLLRIFVILHTNLLSAIYKILLFRALYIPKYFLRCTGHTI